MGLFDLRSLWFNGLCALVVALGLVVTTLGLFLDCVLV